ncbi:MAG: SLC13 family permease [Dehalococcoidales bacterium]|jgi:Na+/H+ antiporter NhaD/arsenite permease-like protein
MLVAQILAIVIFLAMFIAIIIGRVHRYIPALIGAGFTILVVFLIVLRDPETVVRVLNLGQLIELDFWLPRGAHVESQGVNWQTMVFIGGMMVMVEGLGEVGFFRWLCLYLARLVRCRVIPILLVFMVLSGFLSMFIDSITVMLFLATVTVELSRMLKFDPVPVIIAEIFASNTGGSATMSGDPPNIIIGTALNYTFADFATNTGPIAWIGMVIALVFFYLVFRKLLTQAGDSEELLRLCPVPQTAITNPRMFRINTGIFILVVVLLVTHAETGLSVAIIGVIAALLTLLFSGRVAGHLMKRVDCRTLPFFFGLFVTVGGMEETGVLKVVAGYIGDMSGGSIFLVIPIILYLSAFSSAIVDNIPFAAVMVPVIKQLALTSGFNLPTLAWTLALGTDIGGNATPIGASANVVGTAIAEREGHRISWGRYMKYAVPATLIVIVVCHLLLLARYS